MSTGINERSIGGFVAEKIVDLAHSLNKQHILDEISIYGTSDKDGSATLSFEWMGEDVPPNTANNILLFLKEIRHLILSTGKKVKEQEHPAAINFDGIVRILYRFRIWDVDGSYEFNDKIPVYR